MVARTSRRTPGCPRRSGCPASGPWPCARKADRRHHPLQPPRNLKELGATVGRSLLRVLFVFDPARRAVLLVGGNKAGQWQSWCRRAIPAAERLYAEHVEKMRKESL